MATSTAQNHPSTSAADELRAGMYQLLTSVQIPTKEQGYVHIDPWLSQRLVIDAVSQGLAEDCHEFVFLKCRQVAATTVCQLIALMWQLINPGTQGAMIADRGDNLERLRRIFTAFHETLPPEWVSADNKLIQNNRYGLAFANGSTLDLLAAGSNPDLGASRAINFLHATECAQWKSKAGVESLKAALARQNPNRLYLWESIANGVGNWFYDFWKRAKSDRHMRAVFLGFWSNPNYSIPRDSEDFRIYWENGRLTEDELKRAIYVRENYDYALTPEQIAWWRRESEHSADEYMYRHYPWTEEECFIASGNSFFPSRRTVEIADALENPLPFRGYRYQFEEEFLASRIEQVNDPDDVQLRVWEMPVDGATYAIGADPTGGGGDDADDAAIEVFRLYADRCVQVAEFQTNEPMTYQLAWVLAHLCGAYRDHMANLEITGIGAAVMPEVRRLRLLAERSILQADPNKGPILDMIGCVRWYLWSKPDTMSPGGSIVNWRTNADNKHQAYAEFRDSLMLRQIEVRSTHLIKQLQAVVEDNGWLGAAPDSEYNDDLADAAVLGHHCWVQWQRPGLITKGLTWDRVHGEPPKGDIGSMLSWAFSQKMQEVHRNAKARRGY